MTENSRESAPRSAGVLAAEPSTRLFEQFGAQPQFVQFLEYKNAVDAYTRRDYSEAHREATLSWLQSVFDTGLERAAEDRDLDVDALRELINELRSLTMGQPGYIAGETLQRVDQPGESVVVSKWQSADYWQQWLQNRARSEIQDKIDQLLGEETQYEIYEYD